MYFFYCLARSPALNTACQTGSSCWWKRTPNLSLNVCNLLCLHACSSPPPPYLTSSINKTAFWVAHSVVWGWQIDDSWFAPRGDAGRDQKIKQNTEIKGWILWEEKRTVVEKKVITHRLFLWERRRQTLQHEADGWGGLDPTSEPTPREQRTHTEKKPCVISLSVRLCSYVCVCTHRWQNVPQQKKPQSHFYRVTGVRGDPTASAPLPWE